MYRKCRVGGRPTCVASCQVQAAVLCGECHRGVVHSATADSMVREFDVQAFLNLGWQCDNDREVGFYQCDMR